MCNADPSKWKEKKITESDNHESNYIKADILVYVIIDMSHHTLSNENLRKCSRLWDELLITVIGHRGQNRSHLVYSEGHKTCLEIY